MESGKSETLPTITDEKIKTQGKKKETVEAVLRREIIALQKQVEELKKKLKEPVILSKRSDSTASDEEELSKLSAGEAVILGRRAGVL